MSSLKRTNDLQGVDVLFKMIKNKVDKEKGVGFYLNKMAKFAIGTPVIGLAVTVGAAAISGLEVNSVALMTVACSSVALGAIAGVVVAAGEEASKLKSIMHEIIKDVASREDLEPVEKVLLSRYFKNTAVLSDLMKNEGVLKTDINLSSIENASLKEIELKLKIHNAKYSEMDLKENIKYTPSLRDFRKDEIVDRIKSVSSAASEQEETAVVAPAMKMKR